MNKTKHSTHNGSRLWVIKQKNLMEKYRENEKEKQQTFIALCTTLSTVFKT